MKSVSSSSAFIAPTVLRVSALAPRPVSLSSRAQIGASAPVLLSPSRSMRPLQPQPPPARASPSCSFTDDFFAGPSSPPRPRPLYQVILFSVTTNLLWYGYYKFCIEEELRRTTGHGPGGVLALAPFMVGVTSPLYLPAGGPAEAGVAAGVLWIVSVQYWLYRRINEVARERNQHAAEKDPLTPWWVVVPGFNLVVGLRSVHFLSVAWGAKPEDDPVVARFPFLGVETLSIPQMLTSPSLWLKLK